MAYIKDKGNAFNYFGETNVNGKSVAKAAAHPDAIIDKAKKDPTKALDAFMYPLRTITKKAIGKANGTPTSEEQMRALIEKVLLEHDLIAPNPHWDHPFR